METAVFRSPIGDLQLCVENSFLTEVRLLREDEKISPADGGEKSDTMQEVFHQLEEYFSGKRKEFTIPLKVSGTEFQQRVWKALQDIPYGETRSYEEIAIAAGSPKALRAVGQANHQNNILILIPCHRVIRKDGTVGGFGAGVENKKYLLRLEADFS